jgi:predicted nuclease with RNAse H fold
LILSLDGRSLYALNSGLHIVTLVVFPSLGRPLYYQVLNGISVYRMIQEAGEAVYGKWGYTRKSIIQSTWKVVSSYTSPLKF